VTEKRFLMTAFLPVLICFYHNLNIFETFMNLLLMVQPSVRRLFRCHNDKKLLDQQLKEDAYSVSGLNSARSFCVCAMPNFHSLRY